MTISATQILFGITRHSSSHCYWKCIRTLQYIKCISTLQNSLVYLNECLGLHPIWEPFLYKRYRVCFIDRTKMFHIYYSPKHYRTGSSFSRDATPDMDLDLVLLALCLKARNCNLLQKQILVCCPRCTVHSSENMTSEYFFTFKVVLCTISATSLLLS